MPPERLAWPDGHSHPTNTRIPERPAHDEGPNLDPTGVKLYPRFLGRGVYALMASRDGKANSGSSSKAHRQADTLPRQHELSW